VVATAFSISSSTISSQSTGCCGSAIPFEASDLGQQEIVLNRQVDQIIYGDARR